MPEEPESSISHGPDSPQSVSPEETIQYHLAGGAQSPSPRKSKKMIGLVAGAVVVVLLVAGFALELYLSDTPSRVYSASLVNSGEALDKLIDYSKTQAKANYKSVSLDGGVHVKSPSGSYDVNLNGAAGEGGDATMQLDVDALGEKFSADVLSNVPKNSTTPDVYVKVSGVKQFLDSAGLSSLNNLDGQWIVIDHTLLETYISNLQKSIGTGSDSSNAARIPTYTALQDALAKAQAVNKQYLFTTNSSKAVLTNEKFMDKETSAGRTVDHYKVGYNKAHLKAYVSALAKALDSSKLNDWSKSVNKGKSLSQVMGFAALEKSVTNAKSDYMFDLWADTKTKLISKIMFTDPSDTSSVFIVTQGYTGGSNYPFGLSVSGEDSTTHGPVKATLNTTLDSTTNKMRATFSSSETTSNGTTASNGSFDLMPSNNAVKVNVPAKAKSITDILLSLGLGSLAGGTLPTALQGQTASPSVITE